MRNRRALATMLAFLSLATALHARQTVFGIDVAGLGIMPTASYKDVTGPALGVLGGFELETVPSFALTGRGGYISHMRRDDFSRTLVPILGGIKITSYNTSLYAAGEVGRVSIRDRYDGDDPAIESRRATRTAWGVGFGSAVERLDLRFSLHAWDANHVGQNMTIGVSLAYLLLGTY